MSRRQPDADRLAVWRAFLNAHATITQTLERELVADRELPLSWYEVLLNLNEAGGRLRMAELADRLVINKSSLSRLCDRLESADLLPGGFLPEHGSTSPLNQRSCDQMSWQGARVDTRASFFTFREHSPSLLAIAAISIASLVLAPTLTNAVYGS